MDFRTLKNELEQNGIRPDCILFLDSVVQHRNYMAHEFLVNSAITQSFANFSGRHVTGDIFRATYELEQIIVLYDLCEEHNCWD